MKSIYLFLRIKQSITLANRIRATLNIKNAIKMTLFDNINLNVASSGLLNTSNKFKCFNMKRIYFYHIFERSNLEFGKLFYL